MSVWKSIKAWAKETMQEANIENIRASEQAKQEELREAKLEAEQPKKTDMERILDAMKASMHEEGRWEVSCQRTLFTYKSTLEGGVWQYSDNIYKLVDTKTKWGLCFVERHDLDATRNEYISWKDGVVKGEEETTTLCSSFPLIPLLHFGRATLKAIKEGNYVPTKEQLLELLYYWNDNISKPKREAERKAKEQQEIDVLKQMYLSEEK